MPKAIFRFYEELNDLLPTTRQKTDFEVTFQERRSVKDMIEALGVPHTEVDLILVNGKSEGFSYLLQDKDHVSVYPIFESLDIEGVTRLRTFPLRKTKFIADINLGDIVRCMRTLGLDVYFDPSMSSRDIIGVSCSEHRIILTKSRKLLKFKEVSHGILIRPGTTTEQVIKIIDDLDIRKQIKPFTICLVCGFLLERVSKEQIEDRIPPKTKAFCDEYAYCRKCDKIYWKGTHYIRMKKRIDEIMGR